MSPSLYFKQMGSHIQFSLTSSPFNTGRRAPTLYEDEPFSILQTDGLPHSVLIDELSLQHRQTSSYSLWRRAQSLTLTSPAAPLTNELSLQHRQTSSYSLWRRAQSLTLTSPAASLTNELSLQHRHTSSYSLWRRAQSLALTSPSLYFKQMGSLIQFSLMSSPFNIGRRASTLYGDEPSRSL